MSDPLGTTNPTATASMPAYTPSVANVQVFMEVAIDLSGNVDVLGAAQPTLYQVVSTTNGIHVGSLYSSDISGILEFWEPTGELESLSESLEACISSTTRPNSSADASFNTFEDFSGALYLDLSGVFCSSSALATNLDATKAVPFNAGAYTSPPVNEYNKFKTLGHMMLAWAAHYAFGHVAATAAIDNDTQIIKRFNIDLDVPRLFMNQIAALNKEKCSRIARSVIAQDPERALNMDNSALYPHQHMALRFRQGDKLYLRVNMAQWTVGDNYGVSNQATGTPSGNNPMYTSASLVSTDELGRLAGRLPFYHSNIVGGTDYSGAADSAEAARGVFFHFEIPVVA